MKKKVLIVDASGFLFRAYYAIKPMTAPSGESTHALFGFIRSITKLKSDFPGAAVVSVFDGPDNAKTRKALYPDYKAHRTKAPPDLHPQIEQAKRFCTLAGIQSVTLPGVEADDTIASMALLAKEENFDVLVVTTDKDLAQIVEEQIVLLNPFKENLILDRNKIFLTYGLYPEEIIDYFALLGDSSDNIPGVAGIGEKGAQDLISKYHSLEALYDHLEDLPEKRKNLLLKGKENAFLSRKLFTLDKTLPVERSLFNQPLHPLDKELNNFYHEKGFISLLKETEKTPQKKLSLWIIESKEALAKLEEELKNIRAIVFDTETTSESPLQAAIVGISLSWQAESGAYIPFNGTLEKPFLVEWFSRLFQKREIAFMAHNGKYDLHVLQNEAIFLPSIAFDTIVASYLLNAHERRHNLDHLALEFLHLVKIPIESLIGKGKKAITMDQVAIDKVAAYSIEDAEATFRLQGLFAIQLNERSLYPLFKDIEMALLPVLFRMERKGIFIDLPLLAKVGAEVTRDLRTLEEEIYSLVGETLNLNSPKQLSELLYEKLKIPPPKRTETGFSTDAETLEKIRNYHPAVAKILTYRTLEKLRSTYIEKLPLEVNEKTERIHPTFNQTMAATGRLSCQDPNLQNIPVRSDLGLKIREAFRPKLQGYSFISLDYSQIELRLLAHMSEDQVMIDAFLQGKDIHKATAAEIFGVPEEAVTKELRHKAKAVNFGVLYGQGAFGLAQEVGITRKEANDFIEHYFSRFPKVRQFVEECKNLARKEKKAATLIGRERVLPEIDSKNGTLRMQAERLAVNTPLQGSAADLIKLAMIQVDAYLLQNGHQDASLILQIHDELLIELPTAKAKTIGEEVKRIMETVWSLRVPLIVDLHVGNNWMEC